MLPGVTDEAASPAIQRGVRTVVTDDAGVSRIVQLNPGVYALTFTRKASTSSRVKTSSSAAPRC